MKTLKRLVFLIALLAAGNAFGQNCYVASVPEIDGKLEYCITHLNAKYEVQLNFTRESADSFIFLDRPWTYHSDNDSIAVSTNLWEDYLHDTYLPKYAQKQWSATYIIKDLTTLNRLLFYVILDKSAVVTLSNVGKNYWGYKDLTDLPNTIFIIDYHISTKTFDFEVVNSKFYR